MICFNDLPDDVELPLPEDSPGYEPLLEVLADITFNSKYQDLYEKG